MQGIGWYLEEENIAQVSTNLLDFETTPLYAVYEEVCQDAKVGGTGQHIMLVSVGASQRMSPSKFFSPSPGQGLLDLMLSSAKLGRAMNSTKLPKAQQLAASSQLLH